MTLPEFLALTGVSERTMRHWTQHGLVPQPEYGPGTSRKGYTDEHVMRVKVIEALRKEGVQRLVDVKARLDAMSVGQMRAMLGIVEPKDAPITAKEASLARVDASMTTRDESIATKEASLARMDASITTSDATLTRMDASITPKEAPVVSIPASFGLRATPVVENHVRIALRDGVFLDVRVPIDAEGLALVRKVAAMCGVHVDVG